MIILKLLILSIFVVNCFSDNINIDSLTLSKIKKMVQKEEEIALAYKKYILKNGKVPLNLDALITSTGDYLEPNYQKINPFGKLIELDTTKHRIKSFIPLNTELKSNIYEFYYDTTREYTIAPLSFENNAVNIILSENEKFIVDNTNKITTDKALAIDKYYLDDRGILHWYDATNSYKFSITNDLLVDQSVIVLKTDGTKTDEFKSLIESKNFMYAGQKILHKNEDTLDEYLNTKETVLEIDKSRNIGQTILKFTKYGGGMIVNGDIQTWGNDSNFITGIGKNAYSINGALGTGKPIINTFVNAKAYMYDDTKTTLKYDNTFNTKKFFSSALRPKFVDFFSDVNHSTCGITTKDELYCGGKDALENNYIPFLGYTKGSNTNLEYLYRSTMFDGISYKSKKVFALGNTYIILGKPKSDSLDGYNVYYWGLDNLNGWAGTGNKNEIKVFTPTKIASQIRFKDLAYTYQDGYRKIAGLDLQGNIYTWGLDDKVSNTTGCLQTSSSGTINFCEPTEIISDINFVSIMAGQKDFIAMDSDGNFYKISQPYGSRVTVEAISTLIDKKVGYVKEDDARILSVDTTITNGKTTTEVNGIVWVNGKNQLKGDYFIPTGVDSILFNDAISKIKWQTIKIIEDNMMCGIDINYQLYCWGKMSVSGTKTYMLPMFMANLHDENKDFLVVENNTSNVVTNMTSGEWSVSGEYVINYPTYISGFNYQFIFK